MSSWNVPSYYMRHRQDLLIYKKHLRDKKKDKVFELLGGRCFFHDEFCRGPLQLDHKYGIIRTQISYITKNNKVGKLSGSTSGYHQYHKAITAPSQFMLLCRRHNNMKGSIPYNQLLQALKSMTDKIESVKVEIR